MLLWIESAKSFRDNNLSFLLLEIDQILFSYRKLRINIESGLVRLSFCSLLTHNKLDALTLTIGINERISNLWLVFLIMD